MAKPGNAADVPLWAKPQRGRTFAPLVPRCTSLIGNKPISLGAPCTRARKNAGAIAAIVQTFLKGRLNGHAVRVPLLNASITDCVFEVERETSVEEVNALFKAAADHALHGILGYEERPLVSADYTDDPRSSIVDAPSTMVVNGTQVKVYAWYENEMDYAHRLVDVALMVGALL